VKFSFERYRGAAATIMKARIAAVEVWIPPRSLPAQAVLGRLHDVLRHAGHRAAWIVPRKYVEKVGDEGFKKAPVGAGPYKFVSFVPGVELVLEAHEQYWRKAPSVKRLVFKSVPDESTRLAMLKRGEADVAYSIRGALAEEIRRTPGLTLKATGARSPNGSSSVDQWDPKSPLGRPARASGRHLASTARPSTSRISGLARVTGSIIPSGFDFAWPASALSL